MKERKMKRKENWKNLKENERKRNRKKKIWKFIIVNNVYY